ncbi:MAG: hypothetical protein J5787_09425 [Alphaproteobacteria bacterium]|nr:hypothetical protein [Alphaproteobacteria bacterium]
MKKFLKKKTGKKCLFYSVLPYLFKYKTNKLTFREIQLFCYFQKKFFIENKIQKKYNFDETSLKLEKILIDLNEKYRERLYLRKDLYIEKQHIKTTYKNKKRICACGESKIKSLMIKNGIYFYHLYLIASSYLEQIKDVGHYSQEKTKCEKNTTDKKYSIETKTTRFAGSSLKKIFDRKNITKLIPLLYGIFKVLEQKKDNLKIFIEDKEREGNQTDTIIRSKKTDKSLRDLFAVKSCDDCDAIYANKEFLIDHIYEIIAETNKIADELETKHSNRTPCKISYWKFRNELLKISPSKKEDKPT